MGNTNDENIPKLQPDMLKDAELKDEIITAIGKTYQYFSRIDIVHDYYEELANNDRENIRYARSGCVTKGQEENACSFVAEEYQAAFLKFADITTLPERMANKPVIEMEYRMKTGGWHNMAFIERHRDESGRLTNVLCAVRLISDEKKKEQQLMEQMLEAQQDAAVKASFLSNMSHNVRTPLNGIRGMLDLANQYTDDPDIRQKCMDKMSDALDALISFVNNLLDISNIESGRSMNRDLSFNLIAVMNAANAGKIRRASNKNISYNIDWGRTKIHHAFLVGNQTYLERITDAIGDNAIKFTNPGGSIKVWCNELKEENGKAFFEFGCEDTGIGMSSEFIAHAADMYTRENDSVQSRHDGAGLGLSIARKLTEMLGGTLKIESTKDVGTTVKIYLSFKIGSMDSMPVPQFSEKKSPDELCVLVAEDNELNMEITKSILESSGISVECASDGLEAVKSFEASPEGHFDAVFMDIRMPNMNGWDAAKSIRSLDRTDAIRVPIIAVSANAFSEDIIESRFSGMNAHISKPVSKDKLLDALKNVIR